MVPPALPPIIVDWSMPFEPSQLVISKLETMVGLCALAISSASWMWSKWPWVMSIRSQLSTFFRASGAAGLFMTQGSMMICLPLALRAIHVPCPTQVKLTCEFSAIPRLLPYVVRKRRFSHTPKTKTAMPATVQRSGKGRSHGAR